MKGANGTSVRWCAVIYISSGDTQKALVFDQKKSYLKLTLENPTPKCH